MNGEPITQENIGEVQAFLKRTNGGAVREGWAGFVVKDDHGQIVMVFQHAMVKVAKFHVDPSCDAGKSIRMMKFCQDFAKVTMPHVLTMCERNSPLYEPAVRSGMLDVTERTAFLKLGDC